MTARKDASGFTAAANEALYEDPHLDWEDTLDSEFAGRGLIARLEKPVIQTADGAPVWSLSQYAFLEEETAPPTVNPSLWRQARLNMIHGLFEVTEGIYQVRSYDITSITLVEGDTGWIVVDPGISTECARVALDLVNEHLDEKPVTAVIYTHGHVDHWGGVKGIVSEADVREGKVRIIAPDQFMETAISENVMAGNAMSRRATYMAGSILPKGPKGQVDSGLGKEASTGTITLIPPTDIVGETPTEMTVDGVDFVFQYTPDTEAPAEMHFYLPQFKALCMAENCTHNLHNISTPRGAEIRDALGWSHYIDEAIELFGDETEIVFAVHHWPTWGRERCIDLLKKHRDMYKYLHDETLRLANHGYTSIEIAEMIELPESLAGEWSLRGYYGTVVHNVKGVYQRYLSWFDGNPANLHPLPPVEASKRYVEFMGGAEATLAKAREYYDQGEYRWVAQVVNHVVFADPDNRAARELQADALEQLGYQAESGPWRNFYLAGAQELRDGVVSTVAMNTASPDAVRAMTVELFFDFLAVRLNGPRAAGKTITVNFDFTDTKAQYVLKLENAVLNYSGGKQAEDADATITLTRAALDELVLGEAALQDKLTSGEVAIEGDQSKLNELLSLLDTFDFWFNIVEP
ncbi:MAG: alkyl/aryl-sulfatase [Rubrobacteraceae bacterium]